MRTLIQILMSVAFVAVMLAFRWALHAIDWAWPEHGLAAAFVVVIPIIFAVAVYFDRKDDGKTKDFWGNPEPVAVAYDFDLQPVTKASKFWRYYGMFGIAVCALMWFGSVYVLVR